MGVHGSFPGIEVPRARDLPIPDSPLPQAGRTVLRRLWFPLFIVLMLGACTTAPESSSILIVGQYAPELKDWLPPMPEQSAWEWRDAVGTAGEAALRLDGDSFHWQLQGQPEGALTLIPRDSTWLGFRIDDHDDLRRIPPLPVLGLDSPDYPHLLEFLRRLTLPLLGARVQHWPEAVVTVSAPDTIGGAVDLAACLREAVASWNGGPDAPWFRWIDRPDSTVGVRLVHHPGTITTPPMSLTLVRRDPQGRPLTMHLNLGDNYDRPGTRRYVVRAMVHELAHALLLWGHSTDRNHILWGSAPPLRNDPSADERRGAQLWRRLPPGLDLNRYGVTPPG